MSTLAEQTPTFRLTEAQDKATSDLTSEAMHNALAGGSRSGKTFLFIRSILARALRVDGSRHAVFRFRFNAVKASVVHDTLPKVCELCFPGLWQASRLDKQDWYLELPNGSQIWFCGLDDKERTEKVLGQEYATLFFNECSQIPWNSVVTARTRLAQNTGLKLKAYYDLNPPSKRHWTYQVFVHNVDPDTKQPLLDPEEYTLQIMNPDDNRENLPPKYLKALDTLPEKARNRFKLGKFADDDSDSLWTDDLLANTRRLGRREENIPDFQRIVVAVDPSGCKGEEDIRSDEVGIVVAALGTDGHGYLIEDLSGRHGPNGWGKIATEAFKRHAADRVVGEINYGGAMVEAVIRASDSRIPYSEVHASRGKVQRAEPIAALYEQGKIHHIGYFPELESQLCDFSTAGYLGPRSPDRADAAIWAFTELFPGLTKKAKKPKTVQKPRIAVY